MKYDPDLMRSILLDAEEIPAGEAVGGFEALTKIKQTGNNLSIGVIQKVLEDLATT